MTDTIDQLQQDTEHAIREAEEKAKVVPQSPDAKVRDFAGKLGLAAYQRVEDNRWYTAAGDPVAKEELAALSLAARPSKKNLVYVLEMIANVVRDYNDGVKRNNADPNNPKQTPLSGWLKEKPAADAGTIPPLPTDPATGQRVRNPWLPLLPRPNETEPCFDHASQAMITEQSPRLAKWLEDCAKNGGQPSMTMLDALAAEKTEADYLRKVWTGYGAKEWEANLLRPSSHATLTEQNLFVKSINDPWILQVHRAEAKAGVPRAHFDNLTICMAIAKRDPQVREVHKAAGEILRAWQAEQQEKAA